MPTRRDAAVLFALTGFAAAWTCARANAQNTSLAATLSPTGKLRAALIASNPVLVTRRPDGTLGGVSVAVPVCLPRIWVLNRVQALRQPRTLQ